MKEIASRYQLLKRPNRGGIVEKKGIPSLKATSGNTGIAVAMMAVCPTGLQVVYHYHGRTLFGGTTEINADAGCEKVIVTPLQGRQRYEKRQEYI